MKGTWRGMRAASLAAGGVPPLVLVVGRRVGGRREEPHGHEELVVALDVLAAVVPAFGEMRAGPRGVKGSCGRETKRLSDAAGALVLGE